MPTEPEPDPEPRKDGPLSVPYEPTEILPPGADDEEEDKRHAEGDGGDDA